jgi:hypothetical protein
MNDTDQFRELQGLRPDHRFMKPGLQLVWRDFEGKKILYLRRSCVRLSAKIESSSSH